MSKAKAIATAITEPVWRPAPPIKVQVRSADVARTAAAVVDSLVWESGEKSAAAAVCRVPATVKALRSYNRVAYVQALDDPAVDEFVLADFGRDHAYDLPAGEAASGFNVADHRRQVCPCYRDPAEGRPPNRLDLVEYRCAELEDARDALRAEIHRIRTALAGAAIMLNFAAGESKSGEEGADATPD